MAMTEEEKELREAERKAKKEEEKAKKTMSIGERLKKASGSEYAVLMGSDEDKFAIRDWLDSGNILLNCLISADPYKGTPTGKIIQLAGPSSTGKTYLCLELVKSAQAAGYFVVLYDSEFANNEKQDMIKRGVDPNMLLWIGIDTVEKLKTQVLNQLDEIGPKDKVAIMIDSIGNLSTNKEISDSTEGKDTRDMTRSKQLKALFRTCTLKAGVKNVPMFLVNHVYASIGSYTGGNTVGGGTGSMYMSSIIIELSKAQDKTGDGVIGAIISAKTIKNRFARERQKVKFRINFGRGLGKYSGLFEYCYEEAKLFTKIKQSYHDPFTDEIYSKQALTDEVWQKILDAGLADHLRQKFAYQSSADGILEDGEEPLDVEPELLEEQG